jgi:hypothetical protein
LAGAVSPYRVPEAIVKDCIKKKFCRSREPVILPNLAPYLWRDFTKQLLPCFLFWRFYWSESKDFCVLGFVVWRCGFAVIDGAHFLKSAEFYERSWPLAHDVCYI